MAKWIGVCLAGGLALAFIALLISRPYARAERFVDDALKRHAPAGTTIESINISFPSDIVLTNVSIPVRMNGQQRRLPLEKLSGRLSILSLLQGKMETEMNSDFFGGILWLNVRIDTLPQSSSNGSQLAAFEARARQLDIAKLCTFLQTPIVASGRCDFDAEAELDGRNPTGLRGWTLVKGEQIEIPRVDLDMLSLPPNRQVALTARLSAEDGKLFIEKLQLVGTAYDLSGKGLIRLSEQVEQSAIDCSLSAILKERVSITDERLSRSSAEQIVGTLITTRSKVFLKLTGTLEEPKARLDAASSLGSILDQLGR